MADRMLAPLAIPAPDPERSGHIFPSAMLQRMLYDTEVVAWRLPASLGYLSSSGVDGGVMSLLLSPLFGQTHWGVKILVQRRNWGFPTTVLREYFSDPVQAENRLHRILAEWDMAYYDGLPRVGRSVLRDQRRQWLAGVRATRKSQRSDTRAA